MAIIDRYENKNINKTRTQINTNEQNNDLMVSETKFDRSYQNNIRPKNFDDYIGQTCLKNTLKISIEACKKQNRILDHILFYGPPGLGKTTLASVIANEMDSNIKITSAPALERPRDIIGILMGLNDGDLLFIDEIHRLNKITEEILYSAMEDYYLDMTSGKSNTSKLLRISISKFTLIAATTKAGVISKPLRDRFGIVHRLEFYTEDELANIIFRTSKVLNIDITKSACNLIAKCARKTPRIANRLVKRIYDFAIILGSNKITDDIAKEALLALKIDMLGLDITDREIIKLIITKFNGGPVGIETISASLCEDAKTIEEVYEPYLLQLGIIERTQRGRLITSFGKKYYEENMV